MSFLGGLIKKMKIQIFFIVLSFLTLSLNAASAEVAKPSFDCAKAKSEVEKMICADKSGELQRLDRLYSKLYFAILKAIPKDTQQGQKTREEMKKFAKAFVDYRDNMRCFYLAYNDDKKEVEETLSIKDDYGVSLYENLDKVRYQIKANQKNKCIERIYKMSILLLVANTLKDLDSIELRDYCSENPLVSKFSIKGLTQFNLYDKFFLKEYKETIIKATQTLQELSQISRYSGYGYCYDNDDGYICSNGGCGIDTDTMQESVISPLDRFIKSINLEKINAY